jgi:hypothetical protein
MDSRPRNNNGQFAPEEMGGMDPNTTSAAYNPQIIEARKATLAEKLRRAIGLRRGVEESVPQERVLSRFNHGRRGEHEVREFSILNKISDLTGVAQIKAGRKALDAAKYNRSLRDAYRADAVKQNKFPYRDSDLQYKIESGMRHAAIKRGTYAKYDVRRARKLINEGVRRRNISIGVGIGAMGAGAGAGYLATREKDLSAKLRLRELARQTAYDPYAVQAQPAEPGQTGRDFRNAALGIGALGAGGGVAYAGFRGAQAAKSAQVLTDDALKTSGEARKAARSARVAAARVNRAGKVIKTQLTTFPTFKKVASKIFEEDLQGLKELAAKSDEWRTGGYIGYITGGYPNALQGIETQQYYGNKGVEYRKRDALKHSAPGFLAAAAAVPVAAYAGEKILPRASVLNAIKSGSRIKNVRGKAILKRAAIIGIPAGAVFGVNALVGGKKQAVPDRAERLKSQEFSNSEYDRLADKNAVNNIRRAEYIKDNISSYPLAALGGAGVGLAGGGVLFGKRGVNKKAAILGAAGLLAGRAAMQPKINKLEDRALKREGLLSNAGDDTGLALAKIAPGLAGIAGAIAIAANRSKILKATGNLAKKYRSRRGAWEVIPAPKGDLPSRAVKGLLA